MTVKPNKEQRITGQIICPGVASGRPYFLVRKDDPIPEYSLEESELPTELGRYSEALIASRHDVEALKRQLQAEEAIEGVAILEAHLAMMQDSMFTTAVEDGIRAQLLNAEAVLAALLSRYEKRFQVIEDQFFRERFYDIQDIARRIMRHLRAEGEGSIAQIPLGSIVFAQELVPTDAAQVKSNEVAAFVTETGGVTSHAAIVAKAKGIPFVSHVDIALVENQQVDEVIVDGRSGEVIINPSLPTRRVYQRVRRQMRACFEELEQAAELTTETFDGYSVRLSCNIEMVSELELLHRYGGSGIGLFRTEFICLAQNSFPSEEDQFTIYRQLAEGMEGRPVVIRAFDLGGDKVSDMTGEQGADSDSFGCRAIRFLLKEREIFKTQLRAILRASAYGNVGVMFPMISGLPELREAKEVLEEAKRELIERGETFGASLRVGCMIEVPSAAICCDIIARECDFLSIGTNDLVQYTLAVDRGNTAVSGLYGPTHPAVVRMIKMVVTEGNRNGVPVTVCGEIAADPRLTVLLLGLGVRELSVSARYLPIVKHAIRNISIVDAVQLADKVLTLSTASEIQSVLNEEFSKTHPADLLMSF